MTVQSRRGFSIRIFLPDGAPDGLRIVEKSNWTGRGLVCPRSRYPDAKLRQEFSKAGVYALIGPSLTGDLPTVYVGEGDPVRPRLDSHHAKKDFWTTVVVFTSKDDNLNKAHVQYLEARLVDLAREAKRSDLDNGNSPQLPSLSEADAAELEGFLDEMLLIFPVLGVTAFEKPVGTRDAKVVLHLRGRGIEANGYESADGFVVLAGSRAAGDTVPSIHNYMTSLRNTLIAQGVFSQSNGEYRLVQDYTFDSPSTAAGVMLGRTSNGREEWKDETGRTLKDIQTSGVVALQPIVP